MTGEPNERISVSDDVEAFAVSERGRPFIDSISRSNPMETKQMDSNQLQAALRAAYLVAQTDEEREGVMVAATEIAVKLIPSMREYKSFLAAVRAPKEEPEQRRESEQQEEPEQVPGLTR